MIVLYIARSAWRWHRVGPTRQPGFLLISGKEGQHIGNPLPDFEQLWDYGRPRESEESFNALLPQARAFGTPAYLVELLTQIARAQGLQRRFDVAHATLDEAAALPASNQSRPRARYLLERGRVFNSSGETDRARALFLEAWETAVATGEDAFAVDAAHMVAITAQGDAVLEWNLRALDLAVRSTDPRARRWRGALYNNIAWTHHAQGRYAEALTVFEQALAAREEQGDAREVLIARWCIGRTLRSLGRIDEALELQQQLLVEKEAAGEPDGYVHEELAECLLALGRAAEAIPFFARAHDLLSQDPWLREQEPARLGRLRELGAQRST